MNKGGKKVVLKDVVYERSERVDKPSISDIEKFVGLEHFDAGDLDIKKYGTTADLGSAMKKCIKGDILIARRNVYLKRAARCNFDALCSGDAIVLRENDEIIPGFLPIVLNSDLFWKYASSNADGTMSKRLSVSHLKSYEFFLPLREYQSKIVNLVWKIEELKLKLTSQLDILDKLIKSRFIEMFGHVQTNELNMPVEKLGEVVEIKNGRDYKHVQDDNGQYPVYGTGGIMTYATDFLCPENTIIIGRKGTIDNPILVKEKFWNVDTAFGMICDSTVLDPVFLYWYCKGYDFKQHNKVTTLPSLTKADLQKIKIMVPKLSIQQTFADFVEQVDKSKFELQQHIENTKKLQKSIINAIFKDEKRQ